MPTIEDSAAPIKDVGGKVTGAVLVFHDVTDKRRALSAVREEKDRLASLLASITDEVWFADTNKKFTLANPAAMREFGLDGGQRIGVEQLATALEVLGPDGSPRPVEEAPPLRALRGEIVRDQEERVRTPGSGELRYRQVSSAPVRDAYGAIIGSVSVVRDITARKQADEALLKLSKRDAFLVALADDLRPLANVNEIKTTAARVLGQHLRASRVAYAEVTPDGDVIVEQGYADGVADIPGRHRLDDYGPALLAEIRAGRNIVVGDVANAPGYTQQEKARYVAVQVAANLNVPLLKNRLPVALLAVHQAVPRQWTDEEVLLAQETVERTWVTIERARAEQALQASNKELEHFNNAMVGRELRMIELKKEIDNLCVQFGQPPRYGRIE